MRRGCPSDGDTGEWRAVHIWNANPSSGATVSCGNCLVRARMQKVPGARSTVRIVGGTHVSRQVLIKKQRNMPREEWQHKKST